MIRNVLRLMVLLLGSFVLSGCLEVSNGTANRNGAPSTATNTDATNTATRQPDARAAAPMFTLPILKAFLANEDFRAALKTRLQLSEAQINELDRVVKKTTSDKTTTASGKAAKTPAKAGEKANAESAKAPPTAAPSSPASATASTTSSSTSTTEARQLAVERVDAILGADKTPQLAALIDEYWRGATTAKLAMPTTPNHIPSDTRIVVNAPAYRLDVFDNGELVKTYPIGIGYPEFPLPTGMREAKEIIFNPTWTPPDEPWVESSDKVKVGETVEAGSRLNPLGIAKIPIGLPSLIHGGKRAAQIGGFASHGCVGLTDEQLRDFSLLLADLGGASLSRQQIAAFGKDRSKTQPVKLTTAVPVELRYETIVVEDGKLIIYRDVYDLDTNAPAQLREVLATYSVTLEQLSAAEQDAVFAALSEMSRDAAGRLDSQSVDKATDKDAARGKITRTVKGAKEVVIEVAALRGKGYPAAVQGMTRMKR